MFSKLLKNKKNTNHKGFTLVELIVAFAILGVCATAIGGFMITAAKSYSKANGQANAQQEAQVAMNQIEAMIIDAGLGVDYNIIAEDGTNNFVTSDTVSGKYKVLYVFNYDKATNKVKALLVGYDKSLKRLYYTEIPDVAAVGTGYDADGLPTGSILGLVNGSDISSWDLLAEDVEDFRMNLSQYSTSKKVSVSLTVKNSTSEYKNDCDITLRNDVLINVTDIKAIYQKNSTIIQTIYKEIQLSGSKSTTKGGSITINTKVVAESGYALQEIYRWVITTPAANGTETVIYDSNVTYQDEPAVKIDAETKVLSVSKSATVTNIIVYAYVDGNNHYADEAYEKNHVVYINNLGKDVVVSKTDTVSDAKLLKSDGLAVAIKDISAFTLQASADLNASYNETLKNEKLANDWSVIASYNFTTGAADKEGTIEVFPGNIISFIGTVTGNNLVDEEGDKVVKYSVIIPEGSLVEADISETGVLSISRYSQAGTFYVIAYPNINDSAKLMWKVNVGLLYAEGENTLQITAAKTSIYRGENLQLGLTINGNKVDESELTDFNWTLTPITSSISGNPVTVGATGLVSASLDLAYDYNYQVLVTASLKSNTDVRNSIIITVPRVSLSINWPTYHGTLGETIPQGALVVTVIGIVDGQYNLNWEMATQTNPNYYSTWTSNRSYINGYNNTCEVVLSGSEPASLTYMRVRATLQGHSNYYVTSLISLTETSVDINRVTSPQTDQFARGNTIVYEITSLKPTALKKSDVIWTVAAQDASGNTISTAGIGLTKTETGCSIAIAENYYLTSSKIKLTVTASIAGVHTTDVIYITPVNFNIAGNASINRGGTVTLTVSDNYGCGVEWKVYRGNTLIDDVLVKGTATEKSITYSLPVYYNPANTAETVTVQATLVGQSSMVATKSITINQVGYTLSAGSKSETSNPRTYSFNSSVSGIDGAYSVVYKLSASGNDKLENLDSGKITFSSRTNASATVKHDNSNVAKFYVVAEVTVQDASGNTMTIANTDSKLEVNVRLVTFEPYSTISEQNFWYKGSGYERQNGRWVWVEGYNYSISNRYVYIDRNATYSTNRTRYTYRFSIEGNRTLNNVQYIKVTPGTIYKNGNSYPYSSSTTIYFAKYDNNWYLINASNPDGLLINNIDTVQSVLGLNSSKNMITVLNSITTAISFDRNISLD